MKHISSAFFLIIFLALSVIQLAFFFPLLYVQFKDIVFVSPEFAIMLIFFQIILFITLIFGVHYFYIIFSGKEVEQDDDDA